MAEKLLRVDIVILTVLPEEFAAVRSCLHAPHSASSLPASLNRYAWEIGEVPLRGTDQVYSVALGMIGQAGTVSSALAVRDACDIWHPNYLFFVGIAGGFSVGGLTNGDIVVSDMIYGYEYGKIDRDFRPRHNLTFKADISLVNKAISFADKNEQYWLTEIPEYGGDFYPKVIKGNIASGDKVIDNPGHSFFAQVLHAFGQIHAVEMEGAGVAAAIEQIKDRSMVRFLMIRGISDMPRVSGADDLRGTQERDLWKKRAAMAAAAFTTAFIADGLLAPPQQDEPGDTHPEESLEDQKKIQMLGNVNVVGDNANIHYDNSRHGHGIVAIGALMVVVLVVSLLLYWIANRSTSPQFTANIPVSLPTPGSVFLPTATPDTALQSALRWNTVLYDTFTGISSSLPVTRTADKYADVQSSIVNDTYQIKINAPGAAVGWSLPHYATGRTDFLICIDVLKVTAVPNSSVALMFHVKEYVDKDDPTNAYFYAMDLIPDAKMYSVGGNLSQDGGFKKTFPITLDSIRIGGVNRLCVLAKGSHFRYYINGANVYENTGEIYNSGKINVAVFVPKTGGEAIYQFDNLEIRAP